MTSLAKSWPDGSEANGPASRMLGPVGDTFIMVMYLPAIGAVLYVTVTAAVMRLVPHHALVNNPAPFVAAFEAIFSHGAWAADGQSDRQRSGPSWRCCVRSGRARCSASWP
jgi:hypothetical protein